MLEAEDGTNALKLLHETLQDPGGGGLDLLVSDVGLPGGLNGRQLADAVRELVAGLPVLLITGYAGDAFKGQGRLAAGMEMLGKPFELDVLADRIRMMIGQPGRRQP